MFRKKPIFDPKEIHSYIHLLNEEKADERQYYDKGNLRVYTSECGDFTGIHYNFYVYVKTKSLTTALDLVGESDSRGWIKVQSNNKVLINGPWTADTVNLLKEIESAGILRMKEKSDARNKAILSLAEEYIKEG